MKNKVIRLFLIGFVFIMSAAWFIDMKDKVALKKVEKEVSSLRWFNEQIKLNTETIVLFEQDKASQDTVLTSVRALRNTYSLYIASMYSLELNEKESVRKIENLWHTYWGITTFKDSVSKKDLAILKGVGDEMADIESKLLEEVKRLKNKRANYWWSY